MRIKLIKVGNSMGVRLPKSAIIESGLKDEIELTVKNYALILTPVSSPRQGWAEKISKEVNSRSFHVKGEWEW